MALEENLELWAKAHPKEAIQIQFLNASELEVFPSKKGPLTMRSQDFLYHSDDDPLLEASTWFHALPLEKVELLYVYGVGLGYAFQAAKSWLEENPKRQLVFLEDDLKVILRLFETPLGSELIAHPQVHLHTFLSFDETERIFNALFWKFPRYQMQVVALACYREHKNHRFIELKQLLEYDAAIKTANLDEYLSGGMTFFTNFYKNIQKLHECASGNAFFGKFRNTAAIICGAGPSLDKQLPLLKTLASKALIFAGSSSLNALASAGITPHFGAGIDPNVGQHFRMKELKNFTSPFFFRSRFFPEALDLVKGSKLYITGSSGYDISEWVEKKLGIYQDPIEEGRNVVNFCLEIAYAMGCNPIVFVGMDLAYTEKKRYASGIVSQEEIPMSFGKSVGEGESFEKADIYGNKVHTLWKWVAEANWIADFAKMHPEVQVLNATEGGIGFDGVSNIRLGELKLQEPHNKQALIHELAVKKLPVTEDQIKEVMQSLEGSLIRTIEHLTTLANENTRIIEKIQKQGLTTITQSGLAALAELELEEEDAWEAILSVFNEVLAHLFTRDVQALHRIEDKEKQTMKRLTLNAEKFQLLKDIAQANLGLLSAYQKTK